MTSSKTNWLDLFQQALVTFSLAFVITILSQTFVQAQPKPLLFLPFTASQDWIVVQAQHGSFSHTGAQDYAYDFVKASGATFGQPVLAPANCTVTETRDGVADYQNNSSSNNANHGGWGNTVVCRTTFQGHNYFMRFAHMKYGSTYHLSVGTTLRQGDRIGYVGQTGYSTNPHLHFQVQLDTRTPSVDFDFVEGGHLDRNEVVTSRLLPNLWMVDNYGRLNAGADLVLTSTGISQTWSYWSETLNSIGTYATSDVASAIYEWRFGLLSGGTYDIYASCPVNNSRSSGVQYTFSGPGYSKSFFLDQRFHTAISGWYENLFSLGSVYPTQGGNYKVRLSKINSGRMCADAIFIRKR